MNKILLSKILKRDKSLFEQDLNKDKNNILDQVRNSRVLIIGAAGSIGKSFVKQILPFSPKSLHLVDISENNLVELVRDIRSSLVNVPQDFQTLAIALGSNEFNHFLKSEKDYDYVINFSALKHVRSERDPYTLMRMYNTNVFYIYQLLDYLKKKPIKKHFSVSSDKATNPVNVMGATKIFMERVLLYYSDKIPFSTARFANVAFSDGSLLHGILLRLDNRQAIAAPNDVKRYFISHEEAGQLCLLSCFLGNNREIFFPKLSADEDLMTFSEIACTILDFFGYKPIICSSEQEAKEKAKEIAPDSRSWPCYFFTSDTTGEKAYEEFFTANDLVDFERFQNIGVLSQKSISQKVKILQAINSFEKIKQSRTWQKKDMVKAIKIIVPELFHEEKNKNLDQKM